MTPKELFVYQFGYTEHIPPVFMCFYVYKSKVKRCSITRDDPSTTQYIENLDFDYWLSKDTIDSIRRQLGVEE